MIRFARSFSTKVGKKLYQPKLSDLIVNIQRNSISQKYEEAMKKFDGRILFNSVLEVNRNHDRLIEEGRLSELLVWISRADLTIQALLFWAQVTTYEFLSDPIGAIEKVRRNNWEKAEKCRKEAHPRSESTAFGVETVL